MKIILGSASKRRYQLMKLLNVPFEVVISNEEEIYDNNKTVYEQCLDISYQKALDVYNKTDSDRIVIGVDTVIKFNNKIYGKPKTKEEAVNMLKDLSGKYHEVITGISILVYKESSYYEEKVYDVSKVYVNNMDDSEINEWVMNNDVCDMAGGYGIQTEFGKFIRKIEGSYYSIVGLPIDIVYNLLKKYI